MKIVKLVTEQLEMKTENVLNVLMIQTVTSDNTVVHPLKSVDMKDLIVMKILS